MSSVIFTFIFGKAAIPMLVPILIAFAVFVGVLIGAAPHMMDWVNAARDETNTFIGQLPK